jgi:exodeoxyribonuclease-1
MARNQETILWHDYETSGLDPRVDRPMAWAAVRTDTELNQIEDPVVVHVALGDDVLPSPEACLVTGLDPDRAGTVTELEAARAIFAEMSRPDTCNAGFNNMRFDDEVTRFMLWRNLLPAFDREWRKGNSRYDLIDTMRAACALRPDGLEWPVGEEGWPLFNLESLAAANSISYRAHDALSDVQATIELARKLATAQPQLLAYASEARVKRVSQDRLRSFGDEPFVHVSGRFPSQYRCASLVVHVAPHPRFANQVLCVDLRHDPQAILDHDLTELERLLFTPRDALPDDAERVGIKGIHFGRSPFIAPRDVLDEASADRIQLDLPECERRAAIVDRHRDQIVDKVQELFDSEQIPAEDVDQALYDGFVEGEDVGRCRSIHETPPIEWHTVHRTFDDERLDELLFRLRARNHPETLGPSELERWHTYCRTRLSGADAALGRIAELRATGTADAEVLDTCEAAIRKRLRTVGMAD